jgi:serine/threonine-protein kinase ULK/ATG1
MAQTFHKRVGDYIFLNSIGRGAFAEVFKGKHQNTNEEIAIKMISRVKMKEEEAQIEQEIKVLKQLSHPNIVGFLDC